MKVTALYEMATSFVLITEVVLMPAQSMSWQGSRQRQIFLPSIGQVGQ